MEFTKAQKKILEALDSADCLLSVRGIAECIDMETTSENLIFVKDVLFELSDLGHVAIIEKDMIPKYWFSSEQCYLNIHGVYKPEKSDFGCGYTKMTLK